MIYQSAATTRFLGLLAFLQVFLVGFLSVCAQSQSLDAQQALSQRDLNGTPRRPDAGTNIPAGFMDIDFGTPINEAEETLTARGYRFQKWDGWQLIVKNVPLAGQKAEQATFSFSDQGFYKAEAQITIVCDKRENRGAEAFDEISSLIHSKYRKFPEVEEKSRMDRRNYWTTVWDFKTKDRKATAYEIKLYLEDDWKTKGGDWQKSSKIFIAYLAAWAAPKGPTPPKAPSHGL